MEASKTALVSGLALAMGLGALASKAPGAWGCCASWAALAIALALWERARLVDERAREMSERGQEAFAKGAPALLEDASSRLAARSNVKAGALLSMGAMLAAMGAAICALGSFAMGAAWGLLACAPLAWVAFDALRAVASEDDDGPERLGRGGRDAA